MTEEQRKECCLIFHSAPSDENGTDMRAVCQTLLPEYPVIFTYDVRNRAFNDDEMNYLFNSEEVWKIYFDEHYSETKYDLNFIKNDIQFYEGKFYMVSRDLSIFIGRQEGFAKRMSESFPVEDLMVGYLAESF